MTMPSARPQPSAQTTQATVQAAQPLDALTLPLQGLQLIEASAGTGKTYTLAALYLRLVLQRGLFPPQILVMTFTEAATAELRDRIRERLAQAARFFAGDRAAPGDEFLCKLAAQIDAAHWKDAAQRLDVAAQWMDEAAIFTIHGWCSRMLKTHAFDSAALFEQSRVDDAERLKQNAVQDYWRRWFYPLPADALGALKTVGDSPQALQAKLAPLWRLAERAPAVADTAPAPAVAAAANAPVAPAMPAPTAGALPQPTALLARWAAWQRVRVSLETPARAAWTEPVANALREAATAKWIKGVRQDHFADWLAQMLAWAQGGVIETKTLARFTLSALTAKGWAKALDWPVFGLIETLHAHVLLEPDIAADLLAHAAQETTQAIQRAKARAAQFDFSDLLQNLYHALQDSDALASAIAAQYPVALVDEFQDTDPWQFGSLSKIYSCKSNKNKDYSPIQSEISDVATALIMIGDPKQAIYSFRGADLATYLAARTQAQGIYTLPGNYRSTSGVVAAVNRVFGQANAPFGDVPFQPVEACNQDVLPLQVAGAPQVAMTVWHQAFDQPPTKPILLRTMAALFASQMVALLQSGAARSADMAVLVRDRHEAAAIRTALAARGVRSVYLSERDSVFASAQASDLWRILRAVANPGNTRLVRAALATRTWGLDWAALQALLTDEVAWDVLVEQFLHWQQVWRTRGLLPMLYRLLHDQQWPVRLLADAAQGERALTNVLHLGELLQAQSLQVQGEGALIRYLENQLRQPQAVGEAAQLRLESDAHLVQVVTYHKAKGLEYPLVFLPFVALFKPEKPDSARSDAERLAEDVRLLYVALTRAKQALWLGVAQTRGDMDGDRPMPQSALSLLLGRQSSDDLLARLQSWACDDIAVADAPPASATRYQPLAAQPRHQAARTPKRLHASHWWSASFSALTRTLAFGAAYSERDERLQDAQLDNAPPEEAALASPALSQDGYDDSGQARADTSAAAPDLFAHAPPYNDFPAGSAYGTLLHDLLEWQAQHGWPAARHDIAAADHADTANRGGSDDSSAADESDSALRAEWLHLLAQQSQRLALTAEQCALLADWVPQIIQQKLSLALIDKGQTAIQLKALDSASLWPEMGFTLPVQRLHSTQLDARITQHVWPHAPRAPLQPCQLQGMLTGFIDLVFVHQGRYCVLDYKSNKLDAYDGAHLQQAMLAHRYDVQATLYLLALHRLLRARLPDYDFDRHMGGALYVFLRGIDQPGAGCVHLRPPRALIASLDLALRDPATLEAV